MTPDRPPYVSLAVAGHRLPMCIRVTSTSLFATGAVTRVLATIFVFLRAVHTHTHTHNGLRRMCGVPRRGCRATSRVRSDEPQLV
eukprot:958725-Prymnesium_polylepis.1